MFGINPEDIYKYGSYLFIFWCATFLVRKMWSLFEGRLKDTHTTTLENQKILKDVSVIQAQTLAKLTKSDTAFDRLIESVEMMCGLLGGNINSLDKVKNGLKQQQIDLQERHIDMQEQHVDMGRKHDDMLAQHKDISR